MGFVALVLITNPTTQPPNPMPHIDIPWEHPEIREWMLAPGLKQRLATAIENGDIPLDVAHQINKDLAQHRRAMNGDRYQLGAYIDDPHFPSAPLPFAPKEPFTYGREPGSPAGDVLTQSVENHVASSMTEKLQAKMRDTDTARGYVEPSPSEPASLRESIAAATALHTGEGEGMP